MILEIISALEQQTNIPVKPFGTDIIETCILYKYYLTSDNGAVKQYRLELTIISKTLKEAEEIKKRIDLVDTGDTPKITGYSITQNGGGVLQNLETNTVHTFLYYNVIGG